MEWEQMQLQGLIKLKPKVFSDNRGFFFQSYQKPQYQKIGIYSDFVQDNCSFSKKNTIRGLHFSQGEVQDKLVSVLLGKILDVAVDIREDSTTFGQYEAVILDDKNNHQLFIPHGFAHGFCVLSETATVCYKVSTCYRPEKEKSIHYADPAIGIDWPIDNPVLSDKDKSSPLLEQVFCKL